MMSHDQQRTFCVKLKISYSDLTDLKIYQYDYASTGKNLKRCQVLGSITSSIFFFQGQWEVIKDAMC